MIEKFINSVSTASSFLDSYPLWVKICIGLWAILTVVMLLVLIFVPRTSHDSSGADTRSAVKLISPSSDEPLPEFCVAESIEKIREKQGVRPMRNTENEMALFHIPNGVFGWVESHQLNSPRHWIADSFFGPDHCVLPMSTKLSQEKRYPNYVEIHKSDSGSVSVVVFVSDETRMRLENSFRKDIEKIIAVFRAYEGYHQPIAIPRERLTYWVSRFWGDNEPVADVWVA